MVLKSDQQRIRDLLKEAIPMMCKNGLAYQSEFAIEALIGITLDRDDVFLVSIKETFHNDPPSQSSSSQITWRALDRHGEVSQSGDDSMDSSSFKYDIDRQKSRRREAKQKTPTRLSKQPEHILSDANIELEGAAQSPRINQSVSSIRDSDSKSKRPHLPSSSQSPNHSKARTKRRRSSEGTREAKSEDVVIVKDEPLSESEVSAIESTIRDSQLSLGDELPFHVSGLPESSPTGMESTSSRLEGSQTQMSGPSQSVSSPLEYNIQGEQDIDDQSAVPSDVWTQHNQPQPSTSHGRPPDFDGSSSADNPVSQEPKAEVIKQKTINVDRQIKLLSNRIEKKGLTEPIVLVHLDRQGGVCFSGTPDIVSKMRSITEPLFKQAVQHNVTPSTIENEKPAQQDKFIPAELDVDLFGPNVKEDLYTWSWKDLRTAVYQTVLRSTIKGPVKRVRKFWEQADKPTWWPEKIPFTSPASRLAGKAVLSKKDMVQIIEAYVTEAEKLRQKHDDERLTMSMMEVCDEMPNEVDESDNVIEHIVEAGQPLPTIVEYVHPLPTIAEDAQLPLDSQPIHDIVIMEDGQQLPAIVEDGQPLPTFQQLPTIVEDGQTHHQELDNTGNSWPVSHYVVIL